MDDVVHSIEHAGQTLLITHHGTASFSAPGQLVDSQTPVQTKHELNWFRSGLSVGWVRENGECGPLTRVRFAQRAQETHSVEGWDIIKRFQLGTVREVSLVGGAFTCTLTGRVEGETRLHEWRVIGTDGVSRRVFACGPVHDVESQTQLDLAVAKAMLAWWPAPETE